jgi:nickel superoxide dismutase
MKQMKRVIVVALLSIFFITSVAWSHCEIPCGIYGDEMRVKQIYEHCDTIEKSMRQITKLSREKTIDYNQLVRWVNNKELHANKIQDIVSQYFLHQRIKTDTKKYEKKLAVLHQILVYAMKTKQTTDVKHVEKIRDLLQDFEKLYFNKTLFGKGSHD